YAFDELSPRLADSDDEDDDEDGFIDEDGDDHRGMADDSQDRFPENVVTEMVEPLTDPNWVEPEASAQDVEDEEVIATDRAAAPAALASAPPRTASVAPPIAAAAPLQREQPAGEPRSCQIRFASRLLTGNSSGLSTGSASGLLMDGASGQLTAAPLSAGSEQA